MQVDLGANATLELQGSLLQLRGVAQTLTPLKDGAGNLLVLNGQSPRSLHAAIPKHSHKPVTQKISPFLQCSGVPATCCTCCHSTSCTDLSGLTLFGAIPYNTIVH